MSGLVMQKKKEKTPVYIQSICIKHVLGKMHGVYLDFSCSNLYIYTLLSLSSNRGIYYTNNVTIEFDCRREK